MSPVTCVRTPTHVLISSFPECQVAADWSHFSSVASIGNGLRGAYLIGRASDYGDGDGDV
jgi:hypothetical protein